MGPAARRAASDVTGALSLTRPDKDGWKVPVFEVSARSGNGIADLIDGVAAHREYLAASGSLQAKRADQHRQWYEDMIRTRFGTAGLEAAAGLGGEADPSVAPFSAFRAAADTLALRLGLRGASEA
jgi:LAO/AO transport system kinase